MNQLRRELLRLKETVEVLAGERGARRQWALRRGEVQPPPLQSKPITTPPTAEEFNALRRDIEALHKLLARR